MSRKTHSPRNWSVGIITESNRLTALKTVSARIRGSKTDLEELGESTDDLAEGFSKYADEIKALTGFDIMIDKTHFKDLTDIFEGLAAQWNRLSDTQRARVSEILGGTRQLQVISSILGNWKDAVGAYETAMNSAGAASKANGIYMEDTAAAINQMKVAFEELSKEVINSEFAKFVINLCKTIIEALTQISKLTGGLGTALISGKLLKGLSKIYTLFKKDGFSKLGAGAQLKEISQTIMPNLISGFTSLGKTIKSLVKHTGDWKTNLKAAGGSFKEFFSQNKITLIIAAFLALKTILDRISDERAEKVQKTLSQAEEAREEAKTLQENANELKGIIEQYKTLAKSGKVELQNRESARQLQNKLVELVGDHADGVDLVNGRLERQLKLLRGISTEEQTAAETAANKALDSARKAADSPGYDSKYNNIGGAGSLPLVKDAANAFLAQAKENNSDGRWFVLDAEKDGHEALKKFSDSVNKTLKAEGKAASDFVDAKIAYGISVYFNDHLSGEQYEAALKEMIFYAEQAGAARLKEQLEGIYEELFGENGTYAQIASSAETMVGEKAKGIISETLPNRTVSSFSDYLQYRNEVVSKLFNDPDVRKALDNDEIDGLSKYADKQLQQIDELSGFYGEYLDKLAIIESHIRPTEDSFKRNATNKYNIDYYNSIDPDYLGTTFEDWVNGLSSKDLSVVLEIKEEFSEDEVRKHLEFYSDGGNVDLTLRPIIDSSELGKAGWTDELGNPLSGEYATSFTSTYTNDDNTIAINFTPIIVDENGKYVGALSPEELENYANKVISGEIKDNDKSTGGLNLQIGAEFKGKDAVDNAVRAARMAHLYQSVFYLGGGSADASPVEVWEQTLDEYKEIKKQIASQLTEDSVAFPTSFKEILESKDNDGKTLAERIESAKTEILTLQDALSALQTQDFGGKDYNEWLNDLIQKFPLLAGHTDDLDAAIGALIEQMKSNVISDFDEQLLKLGDDALNSADEAAIAQWREQWEQLGEAAVKFSSRLEETVSAFNTIKSAIDDYNESGVLSLDNMRSILALDDKYINALLNERGEIDLSTESYKRLVEAEALELKAQLLQESLDTVNNITDRAGALEYLQSSQNGAAQSALDLADARWQEAYAAAAAKDATQGTGDLYRQTVIAARRAYDVRVSLVDSYVQGATAVDNFKESVEAEKKALEDSKSALEDQKKALEETKNGYEDALSAVKDLVDWVQDYIKQIKNDEIDALQEKKDTIDELIDAQKELIDAEKEEYEWNKKISEKQNTVAKDALAASIASLDDSSAGRKAQKQANDKLVESRSDMYDTLYDHEVEIRKDALDKLKEEQDEYYDNQIKEIQDYLSNEVQLHKDACTMIDNDNGELYGKLLWYCQNYTTTTEAEFNHMWNSAQSALQQYNTANLGTFELLNDLQGRIYEVDTAIDTVAQGISSYEKAIEGVQNKLENLSTQAQQTIADVKAATDMENNLRGKWYYMWQGHPYFSNKEKREDAIADILSRISRQYGGVFPAGATTIYGEIKHFAGGTHSAPGGLSLVGERGAELRVLNSGDGILTNKITQGLAALGANPSQFIADAGRKLLSNLFGNRIKSDFGVINGGGVISPSISIVVQGDATQSTLNALEAYANKISNDTIRRIQLETLKRTYSSRVR